LHIFVKERDEKDSEISENMVKENRMFTYQWCNALDKHSELEMLNSLQNMENNVQNNLNRVPYQKPKKKPPG
jgi:hypothetical protein